LKFLIHVGTPPSFSLYARRPIPASYAAVYTSHPLFCYPSTINLCAFMALLPANVTERVRSNEQSWLRPTSELKKGERRASHKDFHPAW